MQTLHSTVQTEQLEQIEHEFIGDVITNDLVIINGTELEHADNDMIRCSFVKTNSQIDSYFVEQQETSQLPGANGNIPIESSIATAILNDSSNEVGSRDTSHELYIFNATFVFFPIDIHQRRLRSTYEFAKRC